MKKRQKKTKIALLASSACFFALFLSACSTSTKAPQPVGAQQVFDGTIATSSELIGYAPVRVQGYSLVWGLRGTGSSECPPAIKRHLFDILRKSNIAKSMSPFYARLTADKIIEHPSTAVVHVTGWIPAGTPKNATFDVKITALSSTQTTSLKGGRLFPADLQIISAGSASRALASLPVAFASGWIFVNPFNLIDSNTLASQTDPREGSIIGGGTSLRDRNIQLVLYNPSARLAQQIQNRINSRFARIEDVKVANGLNRSRIQLIVPDEYRDHYAHFISLVLALYLDDRPGFVDAKLTELGELANQSGADYEAIALVWESIGRLTLKQLEMFYGQPSGCRAYYAARTALNLGKLNVIDVLAEMALDSEHPCQILAANDLVRFNSDPKARQTLVRMLESDQADLRLAGYRGLRDIRDSHIRTAQFPGGFIVDQVQSSGQEELVVWLDGTPRLVLFGRNVRCPENLFFESSDQQIIISGEPGSGQATIMRKIGQKKDHLASFHSSLDLLEIVHVLAKPIRREGSEKPRGAGLSFSEIVGLLYEMCREEQQVLEVKFRLYRGQQNRSDSGIEGALTRQK